MSPALCHYLGLKRRYAGLVEAKIAIKRDIVAAEHLLADAEACFTDSEKSEWRALDLPKEIH